jgi:hypothetical protein
VRRQGRAHPLAYPEAKGGLIVTDDTLKPPEVLNRFVHVVLSYKPKPKSKPARKRKRASYKLVKIAKEKAPE